MGFTLKSDISCGLFLIEKIPLLFDLLPYVQKFQLYCINSSSISINRWEYSGTVVVVVVVVLQGLGLLVCAGSEIISLKLMIPFRQLVGLRGRGISPTQGLYLHRTTQTQKNAGTHPCLEWDSNPTIGRRQYVL
jgi:hypothetical protein